MIIYKITNLINSKVYVGQTTRPLDKRWKEHCRKSVAKKGFSLLSSAIQKYGKSNFKIEEIDGANSQSELNYLETHYIYKLNSLYSENGYNILIKNKGSGKFTKKTKARISQSLVGKEAHNKDSVYCLNNNTIYPSQTEAAKSLKLGQQSVNSVVNGKRKHIKGYLFLKLKDWDGNKYTQEQIDSIFDGFKKDTFKKQSKIRKNKNGKHFSKKIICLNNGSIYNSITEAARVLKLKQPGISGVLTKIRKQYKGYFFEYLEKWDKNTDRLCEIEKIEKNNKDSFKNKMRDKLGKKIICITNNKTYDSIAEAADDLNILISGIGHVLKGDFNSYKGYKFEYYNIE